MQDDFEGRFPGEWVVKDERYGYGEYFWGKTNCRSRQGKYSAWAIGAGASGSSLSCGSSYYYFTDSWMTFGRFSLADASAANVQFDAWINSEKGYDALCAVASVNAYNYDGYCWSGSSGGWTRLVLDLSSVNGLGSLLGKPDVWISFVFLSDGSYNYYEGAYIDNVILQQYINLPASSDAHPTERSSLDPPIGNSLHREGRELILSP